MSRKENPAFLRQPEPVEVLVRRAYAISIALPKIATVFDELGEADHPSFSPKPNNYFQRRNLHNFPYLPLGEQVLRVAELGEGRKRIDSIHTTLTSHLTQLEKRIIARAPVELAEAQAVFTRVERVHSLGTEQGKEFIKDQELEMAKEAVAGLKRIADQYLKNPRAALDPEARLLILGERTIRLRPSEWPLVEKLISNPNIAFTNIELNELMRAAGYRSRIRVVMGSVNKQAGFNLFEYALLTEDETQLHGWVYRSPPDTEDKKPTVSTIKIIDFENREIDINGMHIKFGGGWEAPSVGWNAFLILVADALASPQRVYSIFEMDLIAKRAGSVVKENPARRLFDKLKDKIEYPKSPTILIKTGKPASATYEFKATIGDVNTDELQRQLQGIDMVFLENLGTRGRPECETLSYLFHAVLNDGLKWEDLQALLWDLYPGEKIVQSRGRSKRQTYSFNEVNNLFLIAFTKLYAETQIPFARNCWNEEDKKLFGDYQRSAQRVLDRKHPQETISVDDYIKYLRGMLHKSKNDFRTPPLGDDEIILIDLERISTPS